MDQHLGQVQASVQERSQRELAGACQAGAGGEAAGQHAARTDGAAMAMQLHHVLGSVRPRLQHDQGQHLRVQQSQGYSYVES